MSVTAKLNEEELKRYSKQILIKNIGGPGQLKLKNTKIIVIGAGGLGAPVIMHLSSVGVGCIGIVDFDKVDVSNLQRQFIHNVNSVGLPKVDSAKTFVSQLNPNILVNTYQIDAKDRGFKDIISKYDDIRSLFANQKISKHYGYKPKHFSFNVDGGRCDECKGEGSIKIEMQFMSDIILQCEICKGKRFKKEVLKVKFEKMNIDDVLNLTIKDAYNFFQENKQNKITNKLKALLDVGMGYVKLGQSSSTLSGGEAQRIKLASFLLKGSCKEKTLFIFDEPTTGLHFHDIKKLIKSFNLLIEFGHSIIIVEHNLDLIKSSDYIIDLGPHGGDKGGELVFKGTPEELIKDGKSLLVNHLKPKLSV